MRFYKITIFFEAFETFDKILNDINKESTKLKFRAELHLYESLSTQTALQHKGEAYYTNLHYNIVRKSVKIITVFLHSTRFKYQMNSLQYDRT